MNELILGTHKLNWLRSKNETELEILALLFKKKIEIFRAFSFTEHAEMQ